VGRGASSIPIREPTPDVIPKPAGQVKLVDLGVIDFAKVFAEGPQTLYTMSVGEYLKSIKYTLDKRVAADVLFDVHIGMGTIRSFSWYGFAHLREDGTHENEWDTDSMAVNTFAFDSYATLGKEGQIGTDTQGIPISPASDGAIIAALIDPELASVGKGVRFGPVAAWKAKTSYDTETGANPGVANPPPLVNGIIKANGTVWLNVGETGETGEVEPNFKKAAEEGAEKEEPGKIADGAQIVWKDTKGGVPTVGHVHAVAEIWIP
jgi:hypothetical protein